MTINEVETLQDLGIYFSDWMRFNCNLYDDASIRKANNFLEDLTQRFSLSSEERNYIFSRVFIQESQSNEATLRLARMANSIKIKMRAKGK